jgi:CTP synthase
LGIQLAVIEAARAQTGFEEANSAEFNPETPHPVIHQLSKWEKEGVDQAYEGSHRGYGGTMRLGAYPCRLKVGSRARQAYGSETISERHRHRFEVNEAYTPLIERAGLRVVGRSPCGKLCEVVERDDHPFFVGVQFHPELISRPHRPHALFRGFVRAAHTYAMAREGQTPQQEVVGGN